MKYLVSVVLAGFLLISCKQETKKEVKVVSVDKTEIDLETTQVTNQKPVIDYGSLGIINSDIPKGLSVGDKVPDISFPFGRDDKMYLPNLYKEQPIVIIFYRGYWCPVCSKFLSEFSARVSEIEAKGAKVFAFTPETNENIQKTKTNTSLGIEVYSDPDGSIMKAFDVDFKVTDAYQNIVQEKLNISIKETNNSDSAILPVPATFIINKEGIIVYKHFDLNYSNRASVDEILANLPE